MKLSEKIYQCRKKAGLSQEALAVQLGVSRPAPAPSPPPSRPGALRRA